MDRAHPSSLEAVLGEAQRVGLIGAGPVGAAIRHAEGFVALVPPGPGRIVDLGSGGGLPALVVAVRRPDLRITMVDRRGRACDLLRRSVTALGCEDRVTVVEADASGLGRNSSWRGGFDVATARGFGPPAVLAEAAVPLLRPGGLLVVSAAQGREGWPAEGLAVLGARVRSSSGGWVVVEAGECPDRYPRRRPSPPVW